MNSKPKSLSAKKTTRVVAGTLILIAIAFACVGTAAAERPGGPASDIDFVCSGFVAQAGVVPPMMAGGLVQASFQSPAMSGALPGGLGLVQPVSYSACDGFDMMGCESCGVPGACNAGCGMGGDCGCGPGGMGGLLGKISGGRCGGCGGNVSTLQALQYHCGSFNPVGALALLQPYSEAGLCAQRWYDVSVEALFLGRTTSGLGSGGVITTSGIDGVPVITSDTLGAGDLETGVRLSGAMIFGAGGNLELTYMGGQEWSGSQTATGAGDLFSYISDFGLAPANGFDDTDRSVTQTASSSADFHSGELNYRRRTMGPYCRFQGSWLFGMRYFRFDNALGLDTFGDATRFFNGTSDIENNLFGAQVGGDFWWNVVPGVSLGVEAKGAWLKNEIDGVLDLTANSLGPGATPGSFSDAFSVDDGTLAGELQVKLIYRLSHSWTFRSAYYLITIEDVASGNFDGDFIVDAIQNTATQPSFDMGSLVLQGFSFGTEYTW